MTNITILAATLSTACCMNYVGVISALAKGLSRALSRMFAEDAGKVARKLDNGTSSIQGKGGKFEWFGHSAQSRVLVKIAGRHGASWFSLVGNREPMAYTPMPADDYRDKPQSEWPVPDIIDWRYADQPIVTQTGEYMAISYAVIAGMENALKRKFDLSIKLSENRLVSVSRSQSIDDSFTAAGHYGLVSTRIEASNGFTLGANHTYTSIAKMSPVVFPLQDNAAVTNAMNGQHPVILVLGIDDAFRSNRGGVLTIPANQPSSNHAVTVVGYRLDKANPAASYYIIRNSWGTEWGDKGYAYLPMNYCQAVRCAAFAVDKVTIQDGSK